MIIPAIDPDTLIELFAEATAWQAEVLRQAVITEGLLPAAVTVPSRARRREG